MKTAVDKTDRRIKTLYYLTLGTAALHVLLGLIAGLQNCPLRELGFFATVFGILAFICVIGAAMVHPLAMVGALLVIMLPGMLAAVLIRGILYGFLVMLFVAPAAAFLEILETIALIYFGI